ncbi:MAG: ATP-binding protein [Saprospiraceae bacterium]|nr:ATP-binding protein [Saprospiraceae bacterium]
MQYERTQLPLLVRRMQEKRRFIQVLAGPRQVGKTTIAQQLTGKLAMASHYAAADAVAMAGTVWIEQQWETARIRQQQAGALEFMLIIDEIQKVPNWSETVKRLWDEDTHLGRNLKVILLGSSRLLLQQGLTESLAGRFELTYIGHWSFSEMQAAFGWDAERFVWYGGYPGAAELAEDEERWKRYILESLVETSISKDILMLTRVDKPALLRQVFELGCLFSGQVLSYNKMLGQLQDSGNTTTLATYLHLLGQAGLLSGLEKFTGSPVAARASSPKLQVHNTALLSIQRNETFAQIRQQDVWGRWVESAIGAHLLNSALTYGYNLYYWRERSYEVDFVLEKRGKVIAIEVKSVASASKGAGMHTFQTLYKPDRLLLVGDTGLPWKEFLALEPDGLF